MSPCSLSLFQNGLPTTIIFCFSSDPSLAIAAAVCLRRISQGSAVSPSVWATWRLSLGFLFFFFLGTLWCWCCCCCLFSCGGRDHALLFFYLFRTHRTYKMHHFLCNCLRRSHRLLLWNLSLLNNSSLHVITTMMNLIYTVKEIWRWKQLAVKIYWGFKRLK